MHVTQLGLLLCCGIKSLPFAFQSLGHTTKIDFSSISSSILIKDRFVSYLVENVHLNFSFKRIRITSSMHNDWFGMYHFSIFFMLYSSSFLFDNNLKNVGQMRASLLIILVGIGMHELKYIQISIELNF